MPDIEASKTSDIIKRIVDNYLKDRRAMLFLALFAMVIVAAMTASFTALIKYVVDDVLIAKDKDLIIPMASAVMLCFLVRGVAGYTQAILVNTIGQGVVSQIQQQLMAGFLSMDLRFFQDRSSGILTAHMVSDANLMRSAVSDTLTGIGKNLLTLLFLIGVMVWRDWVLSLVALTIFPFAAWFVAFLGKKLRKVSGRTQDSVGDLTSMLGQVFQGIRQVKAYGQEKFELERTGKVVEQIRDLNLKIVRIGNLSAPVNELLVGLVVFFLIVYGGYQTAAGELTPGDLMSFITAFLSAYEPMKKLAKLNNNLQVGLAAADRVFALMDQKPTIQDHHGATQLDTKQVELCFENIGFSYDDGQKILDDISVTIKSGQVVALVGPSGAGKTTLLNLVPRFYDASSGQIKMNGTDIKDLTISSLRQHVSLVSQDIVLFDDTIAANIAYSDQDIDQDKVIAAARQANAHDFIEALPEGYQTRIGEGGSRLSGGQKQRIAIARAILKDAPVLLLDEATSALDSESERLVQDSLEAMQKTKTTLVIAHRLSTVRNADLILVFDQGRIVEKGTHTELLSQKGLYANLAGKDLI